MMCSRMRYCFVHIYLFLPLLCQHLLMVGKLTEFVSVAGLGTLLVLGSSGGVHVINTRPCGSCWRWMGYQRDQSSSTKYASSCELAAATCWF